MNCASFTAMALLASIAADVSSSAWAAESGFGVQSVGTFHVGAFAGVFIPNGSTWSASGLLNGLPFSASGNISLKTGPAVGILVGHSFSDYFNIDLEGGYASSRVDKFDGTVSIAGLGSSSGSMLVSGRVHALIASMNFLVTPYGTQNRVTPYLGVGPGFAHTRAKLQSFSVGGMALPINSTSTETSFAANVTLGFDVKLAPQWELGFAGKYVWIDAKHLGNGPEIQAKSGSVTGEIIGIGLEHRF